MDKRNHTILILAILAVVLLLSPSHAFVSEEAHILGNNVRINLEGIEDFKLKVITPSSSYIIEGSDETIVFKPEEPGFYELVLYQDERVEESYQFKVLVDNMEPEEPPLIVPEKEDLNKPEELFETSSNEIEIKEAPKETENKGDAKIIIDKPVDWSITETVSTSSKTKINLPTQAINIEAFKITGKGKEKIEIEIDKNSLQNTFTRIISLNKDLGSSSVIIDNAKGEVEIKYQTEGPKKVEKILSETKKEVTVSSPKGIHYKDVLSYTNVPEIVSSKNKKQIKIFWKEENKYLEFEAYDSDQNGIIDYVEWIVPHLSEQTFEIIIITKAEHLDSSRNTISDIFNEVRALDNLWSGTIKQDEYVRVVFEIPLDSKRDISIFPRTVSGNPKIEVYESDSLEIIATFDSLTDNQYNKVFLSNLQGTQDTFDLRIIGGEIQIDHIIDPQETLYVNSFDASNEEWDLESGSSPYLSDDDDYIHDTAGNAPQEGNFGFANSTATGTINNVTLYFETQADDAPADDGFNVFINNGTGGFTDEGLLQPSSTTYAWDTIDVSSKFPSWQSIDDAQMYVVYSKSGQGDDVYVRRAYLYVDYTLPVGGAINVVLNAPGGTTQNTLFTNFNYTPTSTGNFVNCTLWDNSSGTFQLNKLNETTVTNGTNNFINYTYSSDGTYLWNIQCIDSNDAEAFGALNQTFTIDTTPPNTTLISPANSSTITNAFDLEFIFNSSDLLSTISNCSIFVNEVPQQTDTTVSGGVNQSFFQYLNNGWYNWTVECTDTQNNIGRSENRTVNVNINQAEFGERFWETGDEDFTGSVTGIIDLNNSRDGTQNTAAFTISPLTSTNMVNATSWFMGHNGAVIPGGTIVDFSSSFTVSSNDMEITWKLFIVNSTGDTLLCQHGDDAGGGTPTSGTISGTNSTCISSDIRLFKADRVRLLLNVYNDHGTQDKSATHAWDGSTSSFVDVNISTEGFIDLNLTYPFSDPNVPATQTFNATCEYSCSVGYCRNVDIYIQRNSSSETWTDINGSGNLILATGETNPHQVGNITTTVSQTNFTIEGNSQSGLNNIRCIAIGSYDLVNSTNQTEITVTTGAATAPNITLTNPANATWFNNEIVNLFYNITDSDNDISNSTLILNGVMNNSNGSAILPGEINNFTLNLSDGTYSWTVNSSDNTNLEGTANNATLTFYIDTQIPNIDISAPADDSSFFVSNIEFNFTATDFMDPSLTCNITIDSIVEDPNIPSVNGTLINRTITGIGIGDHLWNVTCIDEAGNTNTSLTRNFSVSDLEPSILLITGNDSYTITPNITLEYNASDNNGFLEARLILDGAVNQTNQTEVLVSQINNFTVTGLSEGTYIWTVNITDTAGLNATNLTQRTFTVDLNDPNVSLIAPLNDTRFNVSTVDFNFTVNDTVDTSLTCTLYVGTETDGPFAATNGSLTNRQLTSLTDEGKLWNVTCSDDSGRSTFSETRFINITEKPSIELQTNNNSFFNVSSFNLSYLPSDNSNLSRCDLYVDGVFNQTNSSVVSNGQQNNFSIFSVPSGAHDWFVTCNDSIMLNNQSENRTFTVDLNGLAISLLFPTNDEQIFTDTLNFTYNASDDIDPLIQCEILVNNIIEDTFNASNGLLTNRTVTFSTGGFKAWNVTCVDDADNSVISETKNFTLAFAPVVTLTNPPDNTFENSSTISLFYNASDDNNNLANSTLILNGVRNNTNATGLLNSQINNFTITLIDGVYTWNVNASDDTNLEGGDPSQRTVTVDTTFPNITLNAPDNASTLDWDNITFNFTVVDNIDNDITCNLSIDGSPAVSGINATNATEEIWYIIRQDGNYTWEVTCFDDAGNTNISETRDFTVEAPPRVTLLDPTDNEQFNSSTVSFVYLPEDSTDIFNCTMILDNSVNDSSDTIANNANNSFTVSGISEGYHNASIECTDAFPDHNVGTSNTTNFTVDTTPPAITLNNPLNNTNTLRTVNFNISAIDNLDLDSVLQCDIYVDGILNVSSFNVTNGSSTTNTLGEFALGAHVWNATCLDDATNRNWSLTFDFNVTQPDLDINASGVNFNSTNPTENETIIINATVFNIINVTATNITVLFFNGDPSSGGTQIGSNQTITTISPYGSSNAWVQWQTDLGTSQIWVQVDPPIASGGLIVEWDETNNQANKSITVGSWHFLHGDISSLSEFQLASSTTNNSVIRWDATNFEEGNIYTADSESSITWTSLQALGKDTNDVDSFNDFAELDALLGMTGYDDSIVNLYINESNSTINTTTLITFTNTIDEVPITNSTNNTHFQTGILWDTSDSNDTEYNSTDEEDIVFVTEINKDQAGAYGTYDYEMRIPAGLRSYKDSETRKTVFYSELR